LSGRILHGYVAIRETGQLVDGHGLDKPHGIRHTLQAGGYDARTGKTIVVLRRRLTSAIATQPHRRPLVIRF
jgi:hypothetical protein